MTASEVQIVHLPEQQRWEMTGASQDEDRVVGYLSYELVDGVLDLQHTVVDESRRGSGLGGRLVEAAMEHARAEQLQVRPTCPFIPRWLADHPEYQDLVVGRGGAEASDAHRGEDEGGEVHRDDDEGGPADG